MAALDQEKVIRFLAEIEDARQVLSEIISGDANEFLRDPIKIRDLGGKAATNCRADWTLLLTIID
jgi:hypothetical protein